MAFGRRLNSMILEAFSKFIDSTKATHPPAGALPVGAADTERSCSSSTHASAPAAQGKSHFCISAPQAPTPHRTQRLPFNGNAPSKPRPPAARLGAVPGRCSPAPAGSDVLTHLRDAPSREAG